MGEESKYPGGADFRRPKLRDRARLLREVPVLGVREVRAARNGAADRVAAPAPEGRRSPLPLGQGERALRVLPAKGPQPLPHRRGVLRDGGAGNDFRIAVARVEAAILSQEVL